MRLGILVAPEEHEAISEVATSQFCMHGHQHSCSTAGSVDIEVAY